MYRKYPQPRTFSEDLNWYSRHGYVIITPEFMVMGRRMQGKLDHCWFIQAIAGDMAKAWDSLPYDLPTVAFARPRSVAKDLRFYPLARVRKLCKSHALLSA